MILRLKFRFRGLKIDFHLFDSQKYIFSCFIWNSRSMKYHTTILFLEPKFSFWALRAYFEQRISDSSVNQKYKNIDFLWGYRKFCFFGEFGDFGDEFEIWIRQVVRLIFKLCSSRLKVVLQVSYKFAYKSKVWVITK
jgi:hypothetical protein